jgi:sugar phosphate permease
MALILGSPLCGAVSDRLLETRKWIVVGGHVFLVLVTLSMAMVPRGTSYTLLGALFFFFGFFRTTGLLMYSQIKDLVPLSMAGMAMAGVNFFTMVGSAAFLQGLGSLMQSLYPDASRGPGAFRLAFLLCAAFLLSVAILYSATKDTKAQER